jgi:cytochrome c556
MKRSLVGFSLLAFAGMAIVVGSSAFADDKTPTIKQVMGKLTKGPKSLTPTIGKELKSAKPNWTTIQAQSAEFATLASALCLNDPPKGDKASWDSLAKAYSDDAKALDTAAQAKDKAGALSAHEKLAKSCMGCHKVHKGK